MAVDWARTERERFERIVEALLAHRYEGAERFEAIDGRGGDGGQDVLVVQGQRRRIFQLKHFVDGFPVERRSRRRQITASFDAAMAHAPSEWTLVVPRNLTPGERSFVEGLAEHAPEGARPQVRILDRATLDAQLAAAPDLASHFTRDELLEQAKAYGQERALLLGGASDLAQRVSALGTVTDTCDPHWTLDFAREGEQVTRFLRAKHALAHVVSPITLTVTAQIGPNQADLREAVHRSWGFGAPGTVTLPPAVVHQWRLDGPE